MSPTGPMSTRAVEEIVSDEWAPLGIRVNVLAPGYVKTEMSPVDRPEFRQHWIDDAPMRRYATPEEIAASVVYLASEASAFMTGSVLVIDGGYTTFQRSVPAKPRSSDPGGSPMSASWRQLPTPARAIAVAVTDAVSAAQAGDLEAFEPAAARLAALNPEQVGVLLGAVVRSLLEDLHPDGLDGDDVHAVLQRCVRSSAEWFPGVDPSVLVVLLTGALGVHQPDQPNQPSQRDRPDRPDESPRGPEIASHAALLVTDLLAVSTAPLAGYLEGAFAEIARAETVEMP